MRFRKSIRIMKGVRVNFSKSGLSLTAGVKGASFNMGSRGTYLNTGILGTGLYDRKRIGNSPTVGTSYSSSTSSSIDLSITVGIDDNGNYYIKDQNGQIITDESLLRKIKRTDVYKNKIIELSDKFANDKNLETEEFVEIYKLSEKIINEAEINLKLSNLTPQKYIKQAYPIPKPDENTIKVNVEDEAKKKIKSLVFWTLKKRRQEYFNNEFPIQFKKEIEKYEIALQEHNNNELRIEIEKNKEYGDLYIMEKKLLEDILVGKKEFVESSLDSFLQSMTLPINFEVSYEYDEDKGNLKVDLGLPEIEDLPTSKATKLSSGKIKVKDKTQKEIKEEYIVCVTGLAFFFSSYFFNISTHIEKVLISGFTQRISKKTGQMNDEYIYSIVFTRNEFQKIEITKIVPYLAFESFKFRMSYSKTFELTTIEPISDLVKET